MLLRMQLIGPNELLMILLIIGLLFGASKIPEIARNLGKSIGEFKKGQKEAELELEELEKELEEKKKGDGEKEMGRGVERSLEEWREYENFGRRK